MSFSKDKARRRLVVAECEVVLADLTSAAVLELMDLPAGAVIDEFYAHLIEVFNSTTSDSIKVGLTGTDDDLFLAATNVTTGQALGKKAGNALGAGYELTADDTLDLIWTSGGGTPSTGKLRFICKYYQPEETEFVVNK